MKSAKSFKRLFALVSLFAFAVSGLYAQDAEENAAGYLFFSLDVSAESGRSHFPIVAVDQKNIYVDNGMAVKKVSARASCRVRKELMLAENYAEVLDIDFNTSSMRNLQRQANAVSDMHVAQFQSETEIALIKGSVGFGEELSDTAQAQIEDIQQTNDDFQTGMQEGLDHGAFEVDEFADTVHVRSTLLPNRDMEDTYCVVVVSYRREDPESREFEGEGLFARARYVGDLRKDELTVIRVRCAVGEFNTDTAEYQLYLFSKEGEPVALSNSQGLKPLTAQQVATFKELSEKTALKRGS